MSALSRTAGVSSPRAPAAGPPRATPRWPWALVAGGWGIAVFAAFTHQRALLDHHYLLRASHLPWLATVALFLAGWQIMIAAMMLPASMPLVALLARAHRRQQRPTPLDTVLVVFLVAYALVWTGFALVLYAGDTLLHTMVDHWLWLAAHPWLIGATLFVLAAASELLHAVRGDRRVPNPVLVGYFMARERPALAGGWQLGLFHGAASVGRCWALMLLLFGVGLGGLPWMLGLAAALALETWLPRARRRLDVALALLLLLLACLWLAHPFWLVGATAI